MYQSKKSDLKKSIKSGKEAIKEIPNVPKDKKEIYKLIDDELKEYSYTDEITTIKKDKKELEDSVKQFKQLSNPKEDFIIARLKELETIDEIAPATEDNDPNGNLNKQGGYTSQIYFSTPTLVDQSQFDGDVIEKGTDSGGSIEIYRTVKDAKRREEYLSNFDGGAFASGSHTVVGTVLVRTSDKLTASQQKELEKQIIEVISRLD